MEILETFLLSVKKCAQAHLKVESTKCIYKSYISKYMYKQDLAFNNLQYYKICHEI